MFCHETSHFLQLPVIELGNGDSFCISFSRLNWLFMTGFIGYKIAYIAGVYLSV